MTPGEFEVLKTLTIENGITDVVSSLAEVARNFGDDPDTDEESKDGLDEIEQLLDQTADRISKFESDNDDHDQHDVLEDLEEREKFSRRKKR